MDFAAEFGAGSLQQNEVRFEASNCSEDDKSARVIAANCDGLTLLFRHPLPGWRRDQLEDARQAAEAAQSRKDVEVSPLAIAGVPLVARARAMAPFRWLLAGEWLAVSLTDAGGAPDASAVEDAAGKAAPKEATARVELRAAACWWMGVEAAVRQVRRLVLDLFGVPGTLVDSDGVCHRSLDEVARPVLGETLSRIDLAVDLQGIDWTGEDDELARFAGRIGVKVRWPAYADRGPEKDAEPPPEAPPAVRFTRWARFSGYWFGRGPMMVRIYNKTLEIANPGANKGWIREEWKRSAAYVEGDVVWRVEVQMRSDVLRELKVDGRPVAAFYAGLLAPLWSWAVGEVGQRGWLVYCRRVRHDTNRSRWPVAKKWRTIQAADWKREANPAIREKKRAGTVEMFKANVAGNLASLAAMVAPADASPEAARAAAMAEIERSLVEFGWDGRLAKRRKELFSDGG